MTYKEFITKLPLQVDPTINWVITFVKSDESFPDTDSIEVIANHVYMKLNERQTLAFQKSLVIYLEESGNPEMVKNINRIVKLQDSNPEYSII